MMYFAQVWRQGQSGFTVWLMSYATGSRVECMGHFNNKRTAVAFAKRHNRAGAR